MTVLLAFGAVTIYTQIGQETGATTTGMSVSADALEITHASIHGIQDRAAQYLTLEVTGTGQYNLSQAYVSVTTPEGSVQLPIIQQG